MSTGRFIVVDGPSGVGKSTVCRALARIVPQPVVLVSEPSRGPIGQLARTGTADFRGVALALLVAADRAHHWEHEIRPALVSGYTVICDRYVPSSLVLQTLDGVDAAFVRQINAFAPAPELTVILTGDPGRCAERAERRGGYSRFHRLTARQRQREHDLYRQVAVELEAWGQPVLHHDIGTETIDQVAGTILSRLGNRPHGRRTNAS